ncbi:MAG: carboxymuconolactone decarboxylase family protein [Planctomycetes bacterium]|nr:carboxymuconolactone decarboxylase family protein [Planctomycetota bacterium]
MPTLPPLKDDQTQPDARAVLDGLQARLGQVPNMYRTFAHAPKVLSAAVAMAQAIRSDLDPKVRELAYLKVTQMTDCHVCRHYHEILGRRAGLTDSQIGHLDRFESSDVYTEAEKDVLRFTEQWTREGRVEEGVINRLKLVFNSEHLVILAATVSQANFTSRFNNVFGVELP